MSGSVEAVLERIDRIEAAFVDAAVADPAHLERLTGLRLRPAGHDGDGLRADVPAEDGWALAAELRVAGDSRLLRVALGGSTCVRRSDVIARHGSAARPIPVPPERRLPAPWHLQYVRPWGSIRFGFQMARPHDYDGCLVEILFARERPGGPGITAVAAPR